MLTPLEISLSLVAGSLAWFLLYASISNAQPWGWYGEPPEAYPSYFVETRGVLFVLAPLIAISVVISTVFLLRGIRGNIHHFSRWGHFILAWPLVDFLPLSIDGVFGIFCLPIQFFLALGLALITLIKKGNNNDLTIVIMSIGWTMLGYIYAMQWWSLVGD